MDPVAVVYYGAIRGALAWTAPRLGGAVRVAEGVGVGILAAAVLPLLKAAFG